MKLYQNMLLLALLPAIADASPLNADSLAALPIPALPFLSNISVEPEASLLGTPAVADRLAGTRGRNGNTSSATLDAVVAGNSATNVSTGSNVITGGAFANMSGLPVVIQNTGANVLIQNATVINLQLR